MLNFSWDFQFYVGQPDYNFDVENSQLPCFILETI